MSQIVYLHLGVALSPNVPVEEERLHAAVARLQLLRAQDSQKSFTAMKSSCVMQEASNSMKRLVSADTPFMLSNSVRLGGEVRRISVMMRTTREMQGEGMT